MFIRGDRYRRRRPGAGALGRCPWQQARMFLLMATLDLDMDVVALTAALVDIPSVSGAEEEIAAAGEPAVRPPPHSQAERVGNTLIARTDLGRGERVVIAGRL